MKLPFVAVDSIIFSGRRLVDVRYSICLSPDLSPDLALRRRIYRLWHALSPVPFAFVPHALVGLILCPSACRPAYRHVRFDALAGQGDLTCDSHS